MDKEMKRSVAKGLVTRQRNVLSRDLSMGEEQDKVKASMIKLSSLFNDFEEAHYDYVDSVNEHDNEQHIKYFDDVQNSFEDIVKSARNLKVQDEPVSDKDTNYDKTIHTMLQMACLPRIDIEPFVGNPLKYKEFMSVFDETINAASADNRLKLSHLLNCTQGKAKEAISSCTLMGAEKGYEQARTILKERFGSPHTISTLLISDVKNGKPVRTSEELLQLSDKLTNAELILKELDMYAEINTQSSMLEISQRLQPHLRYKWRDRAMKIKSKTDKYPEFKEFVSFVKEIAIVSCDPVYGQQQQATTAKHVSRPEHKNRTAYNHLASANSTLNRSRGECMVCSRPHRLFHCEQFKQLPVKERISVVQKNNLCPNCLLGNHPVEKCFKKSVCSVPGCGKKHTKFIHDDDVPLGNIIHVNNNSANVMSNESSVLMPIIPIYVNDSIQTYALLDTGSSRSFCTKNLLALLNVKGSSVCYELNTLHGKRNEMSSSVDFTVHSVDKMQNLCMSNVLVVPDIPVHAHHGDISIYPHLQGMSLYGDVTVDVLIGQDHASALIPLAVKKGRSDEPFATRTLLGWCLNGPMLTGAPSRSVTSHFISTTALERKLDMLWRIDDEGVSCHDSALSPTDAKVMSLWDKECCVVDNRIMLPIPWKNPNNLLPDNKKLAMSRLLSLKKSLLKKGTFDIYDKEIQLLLRQNYAEPVSHPTDGLSVKIWYIPHHCVPKKNGKIRLVFDCAARSGGVSLNESCHQGPDLNNNLSSVLLRFREYPYAVRADIEAMYNQVLVPPQDRDALRFLWFDGEHIMHYRMRVHLFGGVWCSSAATYALRKTTQLQDLPGVVDDTIHNSFYVDDLLNSFTDVNEATNVLMSTKDALIRFGFNLTKITSPNEEIRKNLVTIDKQRTNTDLLTHNMDDKALGIRWDLESDMFYFSVPKSVEKTISKRIMLSFLSSIFDPIGLVSPIVITGKILFQRATRSKISWDEPIGEDLQHSWNNWLLSLSDLDKIKIPRCMTQLKFDDCAFELHVFGDASESAYGACVYLRCVDRAGNIHTSLLFAKHRVCPIKTVSIPRLELQAAVLAARICCTLSNELTVIISKRYFWTDSSITLSYIKNENRRFQMFVANRVSVIRQLSNSDEWYHVSGKDNPADLISRGSTVNELNQDLWLRGALFLRDYKCNWSISNFECPPDEVMELKPDSVMSNYAEAPRADHPIDCIIEHFSDWYKIKRIVGWLLKVKNILYKYVLLYTGRFIIV